MKSTARLANCSITDSPIPIYKILSTNRPLYLNFFGLAPQMESSTLNRKRSFFINICIPNDEAARLYSLERLVEKTPESSVHNTIGCFALYKSAGINKPMNCFHSRNSNMFGTKVSKCLFHSTLENESQ